MNATQAENLRILIRHMETSVNRTLGMDNYSVCGTPSCALGEATICPGLAHLNLPDARSIGRSSHCELFCSYDDGWRLFSSGGYNAWKRHNVTPQEWALEARKVLAENGYSMDEAKPIPSVAERLEAIYAGQLNESEREHEKLLLASDAIFARR